MRRAVFLVFAVALVAGALFVRSAWHPRRERPDGWRAAWDAVSFEPEGAWSLNQPRREVMQQIFFQATPALAHCSAEAFRGPDAVPTHLELLVEVVRGQAQLRFVIATPSAGLSPALLGCLERALEETIPVQHPMLAGRTERWRLGLAFLVHPPVELPSPRWWEPLVPASWRDYGDSSLHVG